MRYYNLPTQDLPIPLVNTILQPPTIYYHLDECLLLFLELQTFPLTRNAWETPAPQTCSHARPGHLDSRVLTTK